MDNAGEGGDYLGKVLKYGVPSLVTGERGD
jgi:hypothetical protein